MTHLEMSPTYNVSVDVPGGCNLEFGFLIHDEKTSFGSRYFNYILENHFKEFLGNEDGAEISGQFE